MYGIAATDAFLSKNEIIDEKYQIFNNAEYLSTVFQNIKFDLIFSHATYIHFVDPIGAIAEAYNILKPGGMLVIEKFYILGCEGYLEKIINFLREQGLLILAQSDSIESPPSIRGVIIQKPENNSPSKLNFPVLYEKTVNNKAHYKPHPDLLRLKINNADIGNSYEKKKKIIWEKAETINADLLNKYASNPLPSLFADEEYSHLHKEQKILFILALVSRKSGYQEYEILQEKLIRYDNSYMMGLFLLQSQVSGNIYEIENDIIFKRCSKILKKMLPEHEAAYNAQLDMIKFIVMSSILKKIKTEETQDILEQFDLPYKITKEASGSKHSLKFSELTTYWQNNLSIKDNIAAKSYLSYYK